MGYGDTLLNPLCLPRFAVTWRAARRASTDRSRGTASVAVSTVSDIRPSPSWRRENRDRTISHMIRMHCHRYSHRLQVFRGGRPRRREEPPLVAFNLTPGSAHIVNSTPAASSRSRTKFRLIGCRHCPPSSKAEMAFSLTPIRIASFNFDHLSNTRAALTCWDVSVIPASFSAACGSGRFR